MTKINFKFDSFATKSIIIFLIIIVGFVLIKNSSFKEEKEVLDIHYVKIAGQKLKVDLALTGEEQERGLSGKSGLMENKGMLFVFRNPSRNFFWMKDMNFPIDMIWIGKDSKIIYIKKDAKPESFPEVFGPSENTKYVLEVVSGFGDKNSLKEGDSVEFLQ